MASAVTSVLSGITGAAVSANPISAIADLGKDLIDKFIPDPALKAQAQMHLLDSQNQMAMAQIDQQNKVIAAAAQNVSNDHYMMGMRAFFCFSMTLMYIWNYAGCRFVGQAPIDLPMSMHAMFATIMLGFVGIPAGIEMAKQVAGMQGDSQVSVLGLVKAGNKS
ncbi:MAG TPA: 3TM-type holin [Acidobacteriaceae bacterium]|jgi:hypothetical protein|nr:3TM-type holin [Acidobacteriaceae bacterium]